jgi:hypothetical protein
MMNRMRFERAMVAMAVAAIAAGCGEEVSLGGAEGPSEGQGAAAGGSQAGAGGSGSASVSAFLVPGYDLSQPAALVLLVGTAGTVSCASNAHTNISVPCGDSTPWAAAFEFGQDQLTPGTIDVPDLPLFPGSMIDAVTVTGPGAGAASGTCASVGGLVLNRGQLQILSVDASSVVFNFSDLGLSTRPAVVGLDSKQFNYVQIAAGNALSEVQTAVRCP